MKKVERAEEKKSFSELFARLHPGRGDEVCADAFAREGDLQGDW